MGDSREYIRGVIKALGCTQKRFCEHAGIHPVHLAEFLSKTRNLSKENCLRLEKAYGISFVKLMSMQISEWYELNKDKQL